MNLLDLILHIDTTLTSIINYFGVFTYLILGTIIFLETGFVFLSFLPGDSLLFLTGSFAGAGKLNILLLCGALIAGSILGDSSNYWIANKYGKQIAKKYLSPKLMLQAESFFIKHGTKAIIIARFIPFVRSVVPFTAGISNMPYRTFLRYSVIGSFVWVGSVCLAGYFLGSIPWVHQNFEKVVIIILLISISPAIIEKYRHNKTNKII
jgi:membrane-associated protein